MALIISHQSALEYWLSPYAQSDFKPDLDQVHLLSNPSDPLIEFASSSNSVAANSWSHDEGVGKVYGKASLIHPVTLRRNGVEATSPASTEMVHKYFEQRADIYTKPYHVLVFSRKALRQVRDTCFHLFSTRVSSNLFYRLEKDVYVVSPELCFLQLASVLSLPLLIKVGCQLCSQFSFYDKDIYFRLPLTDRKTLAKTVNRLHHFRGAQLANKALPYIFDNGASNREIALAMLLYLPKALGGFGLPKPQLNVRVNIPTHSKHLFTHQYYVCDLYWANHAVAVEYDSDQFHTGADRIANDAAKRNALSLLGLEVYTLTNAQLKDLDEMERFARLLAKKFGIRFQTPYRYNYRERQIDLTRQIL